MIALNLKNVKADTFPLRMLRVLIIATMIFRVAGCNRSDPPEPSSSDTTLASTADDSPKEESATDPLRTPKSVAHAFGVSLYNETRQCRGRFLRQDFGDTEFQERDIEFKELVESLPEVDFIYVNQHGEIISVGCMSGNGETARKLSQLPALKWLKMNGQFGSFYAKCDLKNDDIPIFQDMEQLRILDLDGTWIDDDSIDHLIKLDQLLELRVKDTQITPEGRERLSQSLPNCYVN